MSKMHKGEQLRADPRFQQLLRAVEQLLPDMDPPGLRLVLRALLRLRVPASVRLVSPLNAISSDPLEMANFVREWGSRLANAEKNTGEARFAFNAFQRAFFPPEFKCPLSVIGNVES